MVKYSTVVNVDDGAMAKRPREIAIDELHPQAVYRNWFFGMAC